MTEPQKEDETTWKAEEIPHIALPLPKHFRFHHTKSAPEGPADRGMVGRDDLVHEICAVLHNTRRSRGSYLIAGFRGAGKTTLMNHALETYADRPLFGRGLGWVPTPPSTRSLFRCASGSRPCALA